MGIDRYPAKAIACEWTDVATFGRSGFVICGGYSIVNYPSPHVR
jgi:hypothetical protein